MAFKITIARNSLYENKLWFIGSSMLLLVLLNTIGGTFSFSRQLFDLANVVLALLFSLSLFLLIKRKSDVIFLKIQDNEIEYFDTKEKQAVFVPKTEIKGVSTGFNNLRIYTEERIHTLDLSYIRSQKTRWQIKEAIKSIANNS